RDTDRQRAVPLLLSRRASRSRTAMFIFFWHLVELVVLSHRHLRDLHSFPTRRSSDLAPKRRPHTAASMDTVVTFFMTKPRSEIGAHAGVAAADRGRSGSGVRALARREVGEVGRQLAGAVAVAGAGLAAHAAGGAARQRYAANAVAHAVAGRVVRFGSLP